MSGAGDSGSAAGCGHGAVRAGGGAWKQRGDGGCSGASGGGQSLYHQAYREGVRQGRVQLREDESGQRAGAGGHG